jgi:hypothetical protein
MTQQKIEAFEVIDHGVEHEQYFAGCGTAFTEFNHVATGIGTSCAEAIDDALESLATSGWDTDDMEERIREEYGRIPKRRTVLKKHGDECWHYVSIRVK